MKHQILVQKGRSEKWRRLIKDFKIVLCFYMWYVKKTEWL